MNNFYQFANEGEKQRNNPCALCGQDKGALVGKINYIGLEHADVLQCPECGLVSFDPLPKFETVAEGCSRLYKLQQPNQQKKKILRGFKRSFRRGTYFATHHLKKYLEIKNPKILEIGPGDGYFSQGIKSQYPNAEIYYVDVVEDLTRYYLGHFECRARTGEFSPNLFPGVKFDLVIMRDLLEHVTNPAQLLSNIHESLNPEGLIFFITPNGREDFWLHNQRFINKKEEGLTLLNHFHYFLPETLDTMLEKTGYSKLQAFKFGLKYFKKGIGVKEINDFPNEELPNFDRVDCEKKLSTHYWRHHPNEVLWSLVYSKGPIAKLYSLLADREREVVNFEAPQGHEFFVLAKKH